MPWSSQEVAALIAHRLDACGRGARSEKRPIARLRPVAAGCGRSGDPHHRGRAAASRGRGVGRALLGEALRQAANAGAEAMFLEARQGQRAGAGAVSAVGFVKVGERALYIAAMTEPWPPRSSCARPCD